MAWRNSMEILGLDPRRTESSQGLMKGSSRHRVGANSNGLTRISQIES